MAVTHNRSSFGDRWTTSKFCEILVADVTRVVNPDLACIKTIDSYFVDEDKEPDALPQPSDLSGRLPGFHGRIREALRAEVEVGNDGWYSVFKGMERPGKWWWIRGPRRRAPK
jgi:hypothetical protein